MEKVSSRDFAVLTANSVDISKGHFGLRICEFESSQGSHPVPRFVRSPVSGKTFRNSGALRRRILGGDQDLAFSSQFGVPTGPQSPVAFSESPELECSAGLALPTSRSLLEYPHSASVHRETKPFREVMNIIEHGGERNACPSF